MKVFRRPPIALAIALLLSLVVLAAGYFLLVGPRKGEVSKLQKEIDAEQQKIQAEKVAYRELLDIKNRSAEYEAKLAFLKSIIPEEPELPSLIRNLQAAADPGTGAGLPWLSFTPGELGSGEAGANTSAFTFTMQVGGFYDEVVDLVYRIERMPRAVVINGINITASTGFLQRIFSANLGVVQADIQARTFTFASPLGAETPAPAQPTPSTEPTEEPAEETESEQ